MTQQPFLAELHHAELMSALRELIAAVQDLKTAGLLKCPRCGRPADRYAAQVCEDCDTDLGIDAADAQVAT